MRPAETEWASATEAAELDPVEEFAEAVAMAGPQLEFLAADGQSQLAPDQSVQLFSQLRSFPAAGWEASDRGADAGTHGDHFLVAVPVLDLEGGRAEAQGLRCAPFKGTLCHVSRSQKETPAPVHHAMRRSDELGVGVIR